MRYKALDIEVDLRRLGKKLLTLNGMVRKIITA